MLSRFVQFVRTNTVGVGIIVVFLLASLLSMNEWPVHNSKKPPPIQQCSVSKDAINPLLQQAKVMLQHKNPKISLIAITHMEAFAKGEGGYVMICWGCVEDKVFRGDFSDELFGFFIVNKSLTRIQRTLDIVNTPRWNDYDFHIKRLTADTIIIEGAGETYGDVVSVHKYKWNPYHE